MFGIRYVKKGGIDMNNTVLKMLSVENFASFVGPVVFTTETDISKKEYLENTFVCGDNRFNKVSFLYGANGSGKLSSAKL